MIQQDENGFYCYVNVYSVMELPDMFAETVMEWLNTDIDAWQKSGRVDSEYYPLQAEDMEQFEARKDMLQDGVGTTDGVTVHNRRSLHTD